MPKQPNILLITTDRFGRNPGEPSVDFAAAWPPTMLAFGTNLHYYAPLFWALEPAMDLQEAIGRDVIESRTMALTRLLRAGLGRIDGVRILSPEASSLSSPITSFTVDGVEPPTVKRALAERRIAIRSVDHRPFGFEADRVCTHVFNSEGEIERLLEIVAAISTTRR